MAAQTIFLARWFCARRLALAVGGLVLGAAVSSAQTNFGPVNVGASGTQTVTLTIATAATAGNVAVVSQGATQLDFSNGGGGTCAAGVSYTAEQTCTVQVTFNPAWAGERYGAALLLDGSGNVIASAPLEGDGIGPQVAFGSGAAIAFAPMANGVALNDPFDPVIDGEGDVFLTDSGNARVVELPAGGGAPIVIDPVVGGEGLVHPGGVAVDGAGNLYVSDLARNVVVMIPPNGGAATLINPMVNGTGLHYPCGMVIDGAGDLYIADVDNGRVVEVPAGGGAPVAIDPLVDGEKLSYPVTLALDSAGDLFIADLFANRVVEIAANGGTATAIDPSVNGQSLNFPYGIAVDAAGDLYIADANNRVVEVPANGGAATEITPTVNGEGLNDPIGIALDAGGDLFIADSKNNRMVEVVRAQAPAINFAATAPGTASSDSPKTVAMENVGNAALTLPVPGNGVNPAITANFTLNNGAASACAVSTAGAAQPATLAAGATCGLAVSFTPAAAGTLYGSLVLTDNNLNAAAPGYATQTIALSGDAPVATVSATMVAFGPQQTGAASAQQQVTLTNTGSAALTITSVAVNGTNETAFAIQNSCGTSLAAGANCTIGGSFTPSAAGAMTATLVITDNASGSPQKVGLSGVGVYPAAVSVTPSPASITSAQPLAVTVTVSGVNGEPAPTGAVGLTSGSTNFGTATLESGSATIDIPPGSFAAGTDNIVAVYTPDNASALLYASATGENSVVVTASSAAAPPAAATSPATGVAATTAMLAGTVNPNGSDTHAWFLWGTSSGLVGASQTASQDLGATAGSDAASATISGLSPSTTYYYQVVAQSSVGTASGAIFSFTTTPAPYFSMLTGAPLSLAPGATSGNTTTVSVTPWYGFTGSVNLSCAITPVAASDPPACAVPATVTVSGATAQMVTVTVSTTSSSAANKTMRRIWPEAGGAVLACILLSFAPTRRRRWLALLGGLVLFMAMGGMGCSSGSNSGTGGGGSGGGGNSSNPGTSPGTYTMTITGVSGGMTETGTVGLTVE
jgi:sugar lactone lactonase YvrE